MKAVLAVVGSCASILGPTRRHSAATCAHHWILAVDPVYVPRCFDTLVCKAATRHLYRLGCRVVAKALQRMHGHRIEKDIDSLCSMDGAFDIGVTLCPKMFTASGYCTQYQLRSPRKLPNDLIDDILNFDTILHILTLESSFVRDTFYSNSVFPANGYQNSCHICHSPLRCQQVELRCCVPRVQHLNPHSQRRNRFPRIWA